nr:reverse transcriptase domain-containing protein [Tanacetum cinerariifolium]
TIPRRSNRRRIPNIVKPEIRSIKEIVSMADRTMEELLQAPTEGFPRQTELVTKFHHPVLLRFKTIQIGIIRIKPSTSGTLSSNTVPNPKGEMKAVTTRSGLAYEGPSIPTNSPLEKVDEQNTEGNMDKEHSNCPGSTAQV